MTAPRLIALMGLRGGGKTTVGRALASRLGYAFTDLDDLTPGLLGEASPADALARHGEPAFRRAEAEALAPQLNRTGLVLALGGGTPTAPGAADMLRDARDAALVYLHAPPDDLRARLARTDAASRPSLTGRGLLDEIEEVYRARDGLYRELCTLLVESAGWSTDEVVDQLTSTLTS